MRQVAPIRKKTNVMTIDIKHRLYEGVFFLCIAVAIYLFVALFSYHHGDPGWSNTGTVHEVKNAGGRFGAWFSDLFLYFFGYMAYLFPMLFLIPAVIALRESTRDEQIGRLHVALQFVGFILTLFAGCGLANLYLSTVHGHVPLDAGGILGSIVGKGMVIGLSQVGASILLITAVLMGVVLFTGLSWLLLTFFVSKYAFYGAKIIGRYSLEGFRSIKSQVMLWTKGESKSVKVSKTKLKPKIHKMAEIEEPKINPETFQAFNSIDLPDSPAIALPSLSLLSQTKAKKQGVSETVLANISEELEARLLDFGIEAKVVGVYPGPVITRFELELAPGIKVSKVTALAKDLARSLSQSSVRVVEVIPGKSVIGLEIPNESRETVYLRELFESGFYIDAVSPLSLALGKDISGYPVVVDLTKMPHLLVAGTTGSGKSVSLNTMVFSLLFKTTPRDVRFIMVDPKMLELSVYEGIPHLLTPVVTDMKEAANAFRWCVAEMERRYRLMSALGVRNLDGFNTKVTKAIEAGEPITDPLAPHEAKLDGELPTLKHLPYIVVIVDELADMMMVVGKKVEELIARIAQKARAAGIHMILATQRPSVDVITGLIKANIPTRISFQVSSKIDSRTILDQQGAEQLLGYGDMLYLPPGAGHPIRIHGAFVSDEEVHRVVADLKKRGTPEYINDILKTHEMDEGACDGEGEASGEQDELYDQAVQIVVKSRRASISYVQRRLKIGYNRAARLLESMEQAGVVSEMEGNGSREVLIPSREDDED